MANNEPLSVPPLCNCSIFTLPVIADCSLKSADTVFLITMGDQSPESKTAVVAAVCAAWPNVNVTLADDEPEVYNRFYQIVSDYNQSCVKPHRQLQ